MNLYKDKHIYLPIFAVLAVVVGYRAWQDMHPPPRLPHAYFDTYYFVGNDKEMSAFTTDPDDQRSIVVDAGTVHTSKDGTLTMGASPVTAVGLPQREIILQISVDTLPNSMESLAPLLSKTADQWRNLGDIVNDIYIKGPRDAKSLASMLDQINDLREKMHNDYWLGIFCDRKALESLPDAGQKIAEADKSLRTLIMDLKEAQKPGEKLENTIMKIDHDHEMAFMLQVDKTPDFAILQQKMNPEPDRFIGFLLDAAKPAPDASDKEKQP